MVRRRRKIMFGLEQKKGHHLRWKIPLLPRRSNRGAAVSGNFGFFDAFATDNNKSAWVLHEHLNRQY
jgi:hypothetical protein